jgi:hypothetical protein
MPLERDDGTRAVESLRRFPAFRGVLGMAAGLRHAACLQRSANRLRRVGLSQNDVR